MAEIDWNLIVESVGTAAQVALAGLTLWLALKVHRHTQVTTDELQSFNRQTAALEADFAISRGLMEMNLDMYRDPEVAKLYQRVRKKEGELDDVRTLAQMRYRMGVLEQVYQAQARGVVKNAQDRYAFASLAGLMLKTSPEAFKWACTAEAYSREAQRAVITAARIWHEESIAELKAEDPASDFNDPSHPAQSWISEQRAALDWAVAELDRLERVHKGPWAVPGAGPY